MSTRMLERLLRESFTDEQPFGPLAVPPGTDLGEGPRLELFRAIFNSDNMIYHEIRRQPTLIVGRRGGGKTSFLNSVYLLPDHKIIVSLQPSEAFTSIIQLVHELAIPMTFVEEVTRLWETLLWMVLVQHICRNGIGRDAPEYVQLREFMDDIGVRDEMNPYDAMYVVLDALSRNRVAGETGQIQRFLQRSRFAGRDFRSVQAIVRALLDREGLKAVLLIDSLEEFPLEEPRMAHAITGFLKCLGEFRQPGSPVDAQCCLPAELYHKFLKLSSNPNKDFARQQILHWHAGELIQIAASRYARYLEVRRAGGRSPDLSKRSAALSFMRELLPESVTNGLGGLEDPLAYILRHTHLQPRHVLLYLNAIARKNMEEEGRVGNPFTEEAVIAGIREMENAICQEVFSAFRHVHPGAEDACRRCLPYLPFVFSYGELHRVYNQRAARVIPGIFEYDEFLSMMLELGVVGRVIKRSERYISAVFEYLMPHRLMVGSSDELCIHPVFLEVFGVVKPKETSPDHRRAIYPYGSDVETEEYREWAGGTR